MNEASRRKTRNQRKRERQRTILAAVALALLWMMILTMCVKAWDEEPAMSGREYLESIGGDPYADF